MAYKRLSEVDSVSTFNNLIAINDGKVVQISDDDFNKHYGIGDITGDLYSVDKEKAGGIIQSVEGEITVAHDSSDDYIRGLHIYGKSTQDGTPSMTTPVDIMNVGVGNMNVNVRSKNIIPFPYHQSTINIEGVQWKALSNGGIYVKGTPTAFTNIVLYSGVPIVNNGTVTFSMNGTANNITAELVFANNGDTVGYACLNTMDTEQAITLDQTATSMTISVKRSANSIAMEGEVYVQMELGDTATTYQPPSGVQTLNLSTPNGLAGIKVDSNGNYTDENGQQWVCDEIDLERGVYIQRIAIIKLNGTEAWLKSTDNDNVYMYHTIPANAPGNTSSLCDKLVDAEGSSPLMVEGQSSDIVGYFVSKKYNVVYVNLGYYMTSNTVTELQTVLAANPITIYYPLAAPIETPLSDIDILAYKDLHTNYLGTTVMNDAGAHMKLSYNTDTKTYIDNKFEELKALITS